MLNYEAMISQGDLIKLKSKQEKTLYFQYVDMIEEFISSPPSLKQLACHAVRRCLGEGIHNKLPSLKLPSALSDSLMLKELDDLSSHKT